jgi:hypothetical protein
LKKPVFQNRTEREASYKATKESPEVLEYIDPEEKEIIKQVIKATIKRGRDKFKIPEVTFSKPYKARPNVQRVVLKAI